MTGSSIDIQLDQLEKLKQLFPETITEGKIDWEKLQATLGKENFVFQNERYVLNWAGKAEAFKVLQQSTTATLKPVPEESINFETTENVFIEGENLEVLKVLQKAYYGKIKVIEIDPPYNTGNDSFIYPDSFKESKEEYLKRIGEKDEEGYLMKEGFFRKNSRDSGHYHSNWLSMMFPRLFLAKNLLCDDGVIFVHIDDNEVYNLRLMMNEIFGEENFIGQFIWKSRQNKDNRNITGASIDHEYVLCFGKKIRGTERKEEQYKNPDNDKRGPWVSGNMVGLLPQELRPNCHYDLVNPETGINYGKAKLGWRYDKNTMKKLINEKRIIWPESPEGRPRKKVFLNEMTGKYTGYSSIIGENIFTRNGTAEIDDLFGFKAFDFPKPSDLIKELISQGAEEGDIVLDFFSGSATTAHAAIKWNIQNPEEQVKFILVQLPESLLENSEAFKKGYKTIADISKERIKLVIKSVESKIKSGSNLFDNDNVDLGFKVFKLSSSNFKIWRGSEITEDNLEKQLEIFTDPVREGSEKENMLYELILKAGYLLTDKVEAKGSYYSINEGELVIALEEVNQQLIEAIISAKPKKVITLDRLFADNDQLKTNAVLQMKDAGIDFKTI
ncbi:MAG: site-specific DNA-methyltransferase [Bacteroidota bacterium]